MNKPLSRRLSTETTPYAAGRPDSLTAVLTVVCALIIVLLPFHAFLTVWLSSLAGHYTALRLWKEFLLAGLCIGALVIVLKCRLMPAGRRVPERKRTLLLAVLIVYGLVIGASGLAGYLSGTVSRGAAAYGVLLDLRFLLFFGVVWVLTVYGGRGGAGVKTGAAQGLILRHWRSLLLVPAAAVIVFGLLQSAVLPPDFLSHFGYGPATIDAIQTVDDKDAYQRIQSTLRGSNPLGAYLVLVLAGFGGLLAARSVGHTSRYTAGFAAAGVTLALTLSRSAWIGAVAALGWLLYQALRGRHRLGRYIITAGISAVIAFAGTAYLLRDNDTFQNVFFHTDENSQSAVSSNSGHFSGTATGLRDIAAHPLGSGAGSAGPASVHNAEGPVRIAENYFVQIGQEAGIVGLLLFVALNILLGRELWRRRSQVLPRVLLASLIGLSLISLLSHAWADDTIAYVWWGLAGAAMALPAMTREHGHELDPEAIA